MHDNKDSKAIAIIIEINRDFSPSSYFKSFAGFYKSLHRNTSNTLKQMKEKK